MRKSSNGHVHHNSRIVEDFLKLSGCFFSLMGSEIGFSLVWVIKTPYIRNINDLGISSVGDVSLIFSP